MERFQVQEPQWAESANCATTDPELMFPEKGGRGAKMAKKVCANCVVVSDCLASAILEGDLKHGIRGGLTAKERRKLVNATEEPA